MEKGEKDIVYLYSLFFKVLSYVSIFEGIEFLNKKFAIFKPGFTRKTRVELWVFLNFVLSMAAMFIVYLFDEAAWFSYILLGYGVLRTFEIVITQVNILLFDQYRAELKKKKAIRQARDRRDWIAEKALRKKAAYQLVGFRRMTILLIHNFFEIIFWFAVCYLVSAQSFNIDTDIHNPLSQALYISFVTMTTFGQANFGIKDQVSISLIAVQSFIGLVMTLLTFARFVSLLPGITSKDSHENDENQ
ncbi:hypothetical protein QWJ34_20070 [Saccharibacillus sp. CPCC 101409]|uniref:hypothetical protein n=1 Tax=Saccharibacillus sp. CPCC 101409 TaxID=3058041 RepID=UPI002671A1C5|nr:hypothetical protein [Saccharibacillus sp. CPCC 101409]MDO3412070.1 hypothetical protein [Saccharibacillus sp. CPCC 101409]